MWMLQLTYDLSIMKFHLIMPKVADIGAAIHLDTMSGLATAYVPCVRPRCVFVGQRLSHQNQRSLRDTTANNRYINTHFYNCNPLQLPHREHACRTSHLPPVKRGTLNPRPSSAIMSNMESLRALKTPLKAVEVGKLAVASPVLSRPH